MYAEDYMGEEVFSVDDSDITSDYSSSIDSVIREQRKIVKMHKLSDPDYYSYKHLVDGKLTKVECYSTPGSRNAYIRHAISGAKCPHRSGTNLEDLYFKVVDTTIKPDYNRGPRHLFYYNPEEFERHQNQRVSTQIKEDWTIKMMLANRLYNR